MDTKAAWHKYEAQCRNGRGTDNRRPPAPRWDERSLPEPLLSFTEQKFAAGLAGSYR